VVDAVGDDAADLAERLRVLLVDPIAGPDRTPLNVVNEAGVEAERLRAVQRIFGRRIELGGSRDPRPQQVPARGRAGVDAARAALRAQLLSELDDSAW
jgi:hypothetical protein